VQVWAIVDHPPPARRATCLMHSRSPGDFRVMPGGNATSRQIEKGTSNEKVCHTARRGNRDVDCRPEHRHKLLRAVSHDTQLAKREYPHNNANFRRRRESACYPKRHAVEPGRVELSLSDRPLLQPPHRRCVPWTGRSGLLLAPTHLVGGLWRNHSSFAVPLRDKTFRAIPKETSSRPVASANMKA
jgi:hypothetical protein